jgi:capsular exopolysaccharide synthesis family protein
VEYEIAAGWEAALTDAVRELEIRAQEMDREEVQLRQIERDAQANRLIYENFLGRLKETSEQESLQQADARVLSPADAPSGPEQFQRKAITTAGAVGGLALGAAIIFLLGKLNNTFRSLTEVSEFTGLTVLGSIPTAGKLSKRRAVLEHMRLKPSSALAEAVRNFRTSILFSNIDKPPKVVMLTSSVPREGKSTTLMMLALTSVHMGRSAIIVDCDLRLPSLAVLMDDDDSPGLMAVMEGTARLDDAIVVEPMSGLHILSARPDNKPITRNAADILSSERFAGLIRRLRQQYDLVILDTPPVLSVSDARIVSSLADAVIYAIRWDKTSRAEVKEGLEEFASIGCPVTGAVVTMIDESKASSYGYSNYGYHRGKHKEYYTE